MKKRMRCCMMVISNALGHELTPMDLRAING